MFRWLALSACLLASGCALLPDVVHQPTLHNPFPQLSRIAIAPFFNLSHEPTLNGAKVAAAYAAELQEVPGYQVIPVPVVDQAIRDYDLKLDDPQDARRLAQILNVDAVVVGAVTEYTPYYPPRMTLKVSWYAANPNFHPIPAGYGLPWGTADAKEIPGPLVFEAELALAKEQLKTQTPPFQKLPSKPPTGEGPGTSGGSNPPDVPPAPTNSGQPLKGLNAGDGHEVRAVSHTTPVNTPAGAEVVTANVPATLPAGEAAADLPPNWPDPRGFVPPRPTAHPLPGVPCDAPVLEHMKSYRGNDSEFTTALETYYYSRDDARLGGWQNYLQRSDDFMRFCCHMHIWEMLSARGGAGETRVVWRWSPIR